MIKLKDIRNLKILLSSVTTPVVGWGRFYVGFIQPATHMTSKQITLQSHSLEFSLIVLIHKTQWQKMYVEFSDSLWKLLSSFNRGASSSKIWFEEVLQQPIMLKMAHFVTFSLVEHSPWTFLVIFGIQNEGILILKKKVGKKSSGI